MWRERCGLYGVKKHVGTAIPQRAGLDVTFNLDTREDDVFLLFPFTLFVRG